MAVTQILVVYSESQGAIRRIVSPSNDDSELDSYIQNIQTGEGYLFFPVTHGDLTYDEIKAYQAAINAAIVRATGTTQKSDRCAVIDSNGNVVSAIRADPLIDSVAGCILVQSDDACVGWTYSNGIFTDNQ